METICENPHEQKYWTRIFDSTFEGRIDTWDYQWCYACWTQSGLSILPSLNLVSNIGFGPEATHTFISKPIAGLPTQDICEIKHPPFVFPNRGADDYTFRNILAGSGRRGGNGLRTRFVDGLAKVRKSVGSWFWNRFLDSILWDSLEKPLFGHSLDKVKTFLQKTRIWANR